MPTMSQYRPNCLAALKGISVLVFACLAAEALIAKNEDSQQLQNKLISRVKNLLRFYYQDITTPIFSAARFKKLIQDKPIAISRIEYVDNVDDQILGKYLAVKFRGHPTLRHVYLAKEEQVRVSQQFENLGIPSTPLALSFADAASGAYDEAFNHRISLSDFQKMLSSKTARRTVKTVEIVDTDYVGIYLKIELKNDSNAYKLYASKENLNRILQGVEANQIPVYLSFSCS